MSFVQKVKSLLLKGKPGRSIVLAPVSGTVSILLLCEHVYTTAVVPTTTMKLCGGLFCIEKLGWWCE